MRLTAADHQCPQASAATKGQVRGTVSDAFPCNASIDLKKFNQHTVVFNECDQNARTWAVWFDDDFLASYCFGKIINLKRQVRNCLDQSWIRRIIFIACPFDSVWILSVATYVYL
jgi:hypothetical protein